MMIIILLGPPGAGKGTIAAEIKKKKDIPVIATGDILRNAIQEDNDLGKEVQIYVNSGKLVPDHLIMKIIENRIKQKDCSKGFIFDGFPRTTQQAKALDSLNQRLGNNIDQVFYFETSHNVIIERLSARRVCTKCGTIYNINYDPMQAEDECGKCGGELIQRDDDKEETIIKRLEIFNIETLPLVDYYQRKNMLTKINADQEVQERFKELWEILIRIGINKKN